MKINNSWSIPILNAKIIHARSIFNKFNAIVKNNKHDVLLTRLSFIFVKVTNSADKQ